MNLRDLTTDDMVEFVAHAAAANPSASAYSAEQLRCVISGLRSNGKAAAVMGLMALLAGKGSAGTIDSTVAWAFQLGREYELWAMARSMRGAR